MKVTNSTLAASIVPVLICACATMGGPPPEEAVRDVLDELREAELAQDVDRILAAFSDNYSNAQGANKAVLHGFFESAISQGVFKNMQVDMAVCEIVATGDSASASPVTITTFVGTASYSYRFKKEGDDVWRITNSELISQ